MDKNLKLQIIDACDIAMTQLLELGYNGIVCDALERVIKKLKRMPALRSTSKTKGKRNEQ